MSLILTKPLAFLDLESTGLDVAKDRIIEVGITKLFPNGDKIRFQSYINPRLEISKKTTELTGITQDRLSVAPFFEEMAPTIVELLHGSDIAGYNSNNFDIPLLVEECLRAGVDFPDDNARFVDVGNIFKKMEPRTLIAAYKKYCNKELIDAHSAAADAEATLEVLFGQLEVYPDLPKDVEGLAEFSCIDKRVDFAGKLAIDEDGDYIYNFGQSKGVKIKVDLHEKGFNAFAYWILAKDFPFDTHRKLRRILDDLHEYPSSIF